MSDADFVGWTSLAPSRIRSRLLWFAALVTIVTALALGFAAVHEPTLARWLIVLATGGAVVVPVAMAHRSPTDGQLRVAVDGTVWWRPNAQAPGVEVQAHFLSGVLVGLRQERRVLAVWSDRLVPDDFRRLSAVLRWRVLRTAAQDGLPNGAPRA